MFIATYFACLFAIHYLLRKTYLSLPPLGDDGAFLYYTYFKHIEDKEELKDHLAKFRVKIGMYILFDILYSLLGRHFKAIRLFSIVLNFFTGIVIFFIVRSLGNDIAAIIASTIYILYYSHPSLEPYGETAEKFQDFFVVLSYFLVFININQPSILVLFFAGFFLGISSTFKITSLVHFPVIGAICLLRDLDIFGFGSFGFGIVFIWFIIKYVGPARGLTFVKHYAEIFSTKVRFNFAGGEKIRNTAEDAQSVNWMSLRFRVLFVAGMFLWIFAGVYIVKHFVLTSVYEQLLFGWFGVGLLSVLLQRGRYPSHFFALIMPVCIMAGITGTELFDDIKKGLFSVSLHKDPLYLSVIGFLIVSIITSVRTAMDSPLGFSKLKKLPKISYCMKLADHIKKCTRDEDYVLQWGEEAQLYVQCGRRSISNWLFYADGFTILNAYWTKKLLNSIITKKPKFIIITSQTKHRFPIDIVNRYSGLIYKADQVEFEGLKMPVFKLDVINPLNQQLIDQEGEPVDNAIRIYLQAIHEGKVPGDKIKQVLSDIITIDSSNKEAKDMIASLDKPESSKKNDLSTTSNVDNSHEVITEQKKMGYTAFEKGNYVEARQHLEKVLSLAPEAPESHNDLGAVLYRLGDYDTAELKFRKALELSPGFTDATNNLKDILNVKNVIRERTRNDKSIFLKHIPPELIKQKSGMNICVFADFNIAGNLTMLMRLINKYTIHKARCIIVVDDYLSYDKDVTLRPKGQKELDPVAVAEAEQIVAQADFFHIGRSPINFGKVDFNKILNKNNCVIQYFGSEYRAKGSQLFKMHTQTGIRGISWWDWTMLNHGLLFYHIDHMLDLERIHPPISREMDIIKIVHSPTNRAFKKTDFFLQVMQKIQRKHTNVELILLEGLDNSECIRKKQEAHILFDQISVGMYALSALESLAMEQVVLCSLSNFGMSFCPDSPVIPVHQENLYEVLDNLVTHPEKIVQLGKQGRKYVKQKHSPEKGIIQYTYLWDLIANGLRLVSHHQDMFIKESFENKELIEAPIV